ncbi:helix-turn-helix domain-containing protein [Bacillus mycoides]|nr:helix-turn-helix domain-containing protein [Bacillus mycoides]
MAVPQEGKHTVGQICNITQVSRSALYREINKRDFKKED